MAFKGIKIRIYPDDKQVDLINKTFGCCRKVYNEFLTLHEDTYKSTGKGMSYFDMNKKLTKMKQDPKFLYLNEVSSVALQQSLRNLDTAYKRFFTKKSKHPVYKKKYGSAQRFKIVNQIKVNKNKLISKIKVSDRYIKIPTLGLVRCKLSYPINNLDINNVTVEKTTSGKYYAVICISFTPKVMPSASSVNNEIGIDVGISHYLSTTTREKIENPRNYIKNERKLAHEQRKLSRKVGNKKGEIKSKNYLKQLKKIGKIHEKITNCRKDFLHKLSTRIVKDNQFIGVENLNIEGMKKNSKLAKHVSDVSWGAFIHMLEYKSDWYGRVMVKVNTYFPSSQKCFCCGYKNKDVKDLSVREWVCPVCDTAHDRDFNASDNILAEAKCIYGALNYT